MASAALEGATAKRLPRQFLLWLSANSLTVLGDAVLYFALGWAASQYGGMWTGFVLTAIVAPRVLLSLFGGVIGDRFGARQVMIVSDCVMTIVALALAVGAATIGTPIWLLLTVAVLVGIVDAFYLPSSGSMPRRLMDSSLLARGLALQQITRQGINLVGAPVGGLIVASAGVAAAACFDAFTFAVMLAVMILIRPRGDVQPASTRQNVFREALDGLLVASRDALLRTLLVLVAVGTGFLLPVSTLLLPLLARENAWGAEALGFTVGAQGGGMAIAGLYVAWRGSLPRPGVVAGVGLLWSGLAVGGLAVCDSSWLAMVAALLIGIGAGFFTTHIAPLVLGGTPQSHLSRVQAVLILAQSVPLLFTNNVLGWATTSQGATVALAVSAAVLVLSALAALGVPALRSAKAA